ncbi:MAG: aspartyl-tRNA(Asn)/glutamyl-tRNA(Gln) amidotransferase subunit [Variibacter sp.]|nr:aspartyl-tRNA(Asn)/glutamyl-tRNA(Gln) amidotransferase subunit [Variibacter sp.]
MSADFDRMSATEMRQRIARKEISPVEVTKRALDVAEDTQKTLNAFCIILRDSALAAAKRAEDAVVKGQPLGVLHGIPFSVKDLIAVKDLPYTSGSKTMSSNIGAVDAPSVERAIAAGGILIGKTTTSEFGCKPVGDNLLTGITRNPWNPTKTPGGSSAGAAASVAAGITPFALGTDGGGSIRVPASFSGLFGLKGHFGRVPVWPTSATPTLAHVGPIARTVQDGALLFSAVAGYDARDPFGVAGPVPDVLGAAHASIKGVRVAYSPTFGYAKPDSVVAERVKKAAEQLESLGCIVEEVDKVFDQDPVQIWTAEFYAGVGIKLRSFVENQRDMLDPAVAEVLQDALSQDMRSYYEKVFERYAFRERARLFFEKYDILVSPVLPVSSLDVGLNIPKHLTDRNLVSWIYYTYPFNLTGQPAASVCAGLDPSGMPIGLQIVGRALGEYDVVRVAAAYERSQPSGYNLSPMLKNKH